MPITQDRMIALLAAAKFYHKTLNKMRKSVLDIISQEGLTGNQRLSMIYAEVEEVKTPEEVLRAVIMEEAHFKANHKRNDRKREYEQRKRMLQASPDLDFQVEEVERQALASHASRTNPRPAYLDQPEPAVDIYHRRTEDPWAGLSEQTKQDLRAEGERDSKKFSESLQGQEAAAELASHPDEVLDMGVGFGLSAPPPPRVHGETTENSARKLSTQEKIDMAARNNAGGWGSDPL